MCEQAGKPHRAACLKRDNHRKKVSKQDVA